MSYYYPLLLLSIGVMIFGYIERNNQKKAIRNPFILGSLAILYIVFMMVGLELIGSIIGIGLLVLMVINLIRRVGKG